MVKDIRNSFRQSAQVSSNFDKKDDREKRKVLPTNSTIGIGKENEINKVARRTESKESENTPKVVVDRSSVFSLRLQVLQLDALIARLESRRQVGCVSVCMLLCVQKLSIIFSLS